ncbi:Uncharacterised protein [Pragia fontium]|nr:hypothetical protein QQ39_04230 [Pragia fontium]VEJ54095.1 Uncharacterised protein [Pragia fontium]
MITKRQALTLILVIMLVLSPLLPKAYYWYQNDHFSCESNLQVLYKNNLLNVVLHYSFEGGDGELEVTGNLSESGKVAANINRKINFSYQHENNVFTFSSKESFDNNPRLVELLRPLVLDFFLRKDTGYKIKIHRLKTGDYIFESNNIPNYYCSKS